MGDGSGSARLVQAVGFMSGFQVLENRDGERRENHLGHGTSNVMGFFSVKSFKIYKDILTVYYFLFVDCIFYLKIK